MASAEPANRTMHNPVHRTRIFLQSKATVEPLESIIYNVLKFLNCVHSYNFPVMHVIKMGVLTGGRLYREGFYPRGVLS